MRRSRYRRRDSEGHGFLIFAVGAITGATAGVMLARRYRTSGELLDAVRSKLSALREYWDEAAEFADDNGRRERDVVDAYDDEYFEDDEEPVGLPAGADAIAATSLDEDEDDEILDVPSASPARDRSSERALESRVLSAFLDDELLRDRPVDIAAVGSGVIELTGFVRSLDEAARAASCARQVPGVSMVLNRVEIRSGTADLPADTAEPTSSSASGVVRPVPPEGPAA